MKSIKTKLPAFTLVGLSIRTNNKNEIKPETSKIAKLAGSYWGNNVANNIQNRTTPNITYAVYTDYESDENGEYTYFIGEAVDSTQDQDLEEFKTITIPASSYQKFTTEAGKMPDIVISAWQKIWAMDKNNLDGARKYIADFEIYDARASDPNNSIIDIYLGVE